MTIEEFKSIPHLGTLLFLDEEEEAAMQLAGPSAALEVAEAECPTRVFELLHRDQYRPIAAVRFRGTDRDEVRVYFERIDSALGEEFASSGSVSERPIPASTSQQSTSLSFGSKCQ